MLNVEIRNNFSSRNRNILNGYECVTRHAVLFYRESAVRRDVDIRIVSMMRAHAPNAPCAAVEGGTAAVCTPQNVVLIYFRVALFFFLFSARRTCCLRLLIPAPSYKYKLQTVVARAQVNSISVSPDRRRSCACFGALSLPELLTETGGRRTHDARIVRRLMLLPATDDDNDRERGTGHADAGDVPDVQATGARGA